MHYPMIRVLSAILLIAMIITASCMKSTINHCSESSFPIEFNTSVAEENGDFAELTFKMQMSDCFSHQTLQGIDSQEGVFIYQDSSSHLRYDIGFLAGENVQEGEEGAITENAVDTPFRYLERNDELIFTFPALSANFVLENISLKNEIIDILKTVDIQ